MNNKYNNLVKNISDNLQSCNMLEKLSSNFKEDFGIYPQIGAEIEFYLPSEIDITKTSLKIEKEKGKYQYEITMEPSSNIENYPNKILEIKENLKTSFPDINFDPKPFNDDYGSAMHFHINFLKKDDSEFFGDNKNLDLSAMALCHYMLSTFLIFAPSQHYYKRLSSHMAPSHISFGPNNRTVAVRIPDAYPRRLEHRLASPKTDPYIAIFVILNSIYQALKNPNQIENYSKIYGNAFDKQYNLKKLPKSLTEAHKAFDKSFFLISAS